MMMMMMMYSGYVHVEHSILMTYERIEYSGYHRSRIRILRILKCIRSHEFNEINELLKGVFKIRKSYRYELNTDSH